jgi:hypothetical protein
MTTVLLEWWGGSRGWVIYSQFAMGGGGGWLESRGFSGGGFAAVLSRFEGGRWSWHGGVHALVTEPSGCAEERRRWRTHMQMTRMAHKSAPRRGATTADRWDPCGGVSERGSGPHGSWFGSLGRRASWVTGKKTTGRGCPFFSFCFYFLVSSSNLFLVLSPNPNPNSNSTSYFWTSNFLVNTASTIYHTIIYYFPCYLFREETNDLVEIFTPIFYSYFQVQLFKLTFILLLYFFQIFQMYQLKSKCEYKPYYFKYYYFSPSHAWL